MCAMARSHVATFRGHPPSAVVAGRVLRRSAAAVIAAAVIAAAAAVAALAGQAQATQIRAVQPRVQTRDGQVALTVTSVNPGFAQTRHTVTINGTVHNLTGSAMDTLSIGMLSSQTPLNSMPLVDDFAAGIYSPPLMQPVTGITPFVVNALAAHETRAWTVQVSAKALGLSCFGVYPLTAQVSDASGTSLASSAVPLPFWPLNPHGCPANPRPASISWIWPLIDNPHQGPCQGVLLDNALAASIRPGGRLGGLLAAANQYGAGARLTFAIDPALLNSLTLMRQPYQVEASRAAGCGKTTQYAASQAAAAWLNGLVHATAGQVVFATPYADVDLAALIRYGMDTDLNQAVNDGDQIAGQTLGRAAPAPLPAAGGRLAAVAWPAGGIASRTVLEYLAAELKINTVILTQPTTSLPYPPGAVTRVMTGAGQPMNVLLADDSLSRLLRERGVESRQAAAISSVSQLFLAETAMNVAADPNVSRPIVVTPPRRWNPSRALADHLLTDTEKAPWLRPANINQLSELPTQNPGGAVSQSKLGAELSRRLLAKVNAVDGRIGLLESILGNYDPTLRRAVFGIESSWWRSRGGAQRARIALSRASAYVSDQFGRLSLGGNRYVTLGGRSGSVIVSVRNGLDYPIKVHLVVKVTNISGSVLVPIPPGQILVQPGKVAEQKLAVHATQTGKAVLHFSLVSPSGAALPHGRLTMQVQASNFGRIALIICGAALAVFVFASAARAIRQGRPAPPGGPGQAGPGQAADPRDPPDASDGTDSVNMDQPGLTPAGQVAADPRFGSPGHGRVEERQ